MKAILSAVSFMAVLSLTSITSFGQTTAATVETGVIVTNKKLQKEEKREARKSEVSGRTLQQFAYDFPQAQQLKATRASGMDKITFTLNGVQSNAYYDVSSNLIGTVTEKTVDDIPAAGLKYINKHYKNYTIGRVLLYDDNEANQTDMTLYGRQFADADNYFVELIKAEKKIIVQVNMSGDVFFFKSL